MPTGIETIGPMRPLGPISRPSGPAMEPVAPPGSPPAPFTDRLQAAVREVNSLQHGADAQAQLLATGQAPDLQQAVVAIERADLALELTVQVTQKAVQAYQEISRLQV